MIKVVHHPFASAVLTFQGERQRFCSNQFRTSAVVNHIFPSAIFTFHGGRERFCRYSVRKAVRRTVGVERIHCSRITSAISDSSAMELGHVLLGIGGGTILVGIIATGFTLLFQPTPLVRLVQRFQPDVFFLKRTEDLVVALTIDDAPHSDITPQILDLLKENDCKATFFVIGKNMDDEPHLVERMHREGHEVGNHTMRDFASWRLSAERFLVELKEVDNRIEKYFTKDDTGKPIKWFRPGHGFYTKWMLNIAQDLGYNVAALGSLYPHDTLFETQGKLLSKYLLWRIYPGAIIVLHDRKQQERQTLQVLRNILPELKRRNYKLVTLSELYLMPGVQK